MHGSVAAVAALQQADLIIVLGARFDDRVTGKLDTFAPERQGRPRRHRPGRDLQEPARRRPDRRRLPRRSSPTWSTARPGRARAPGAGGDYTAWWTQLDPWSGRALPARLRRARRRLAVAAVRHRAASATPPARRRSTSPGVGQHQMWAAQFIRYERPRAWINSGGLGTMGFAVPAAMGAKVGEPDRDGLGHRRRRLLPDDQPGARHLRDRGHPDQGRGDQQRRAGHGPPVADAVLRGALLQHRPALRRRIPDFVKLAEAYGCVGPAVRQARRRRRHDREGDGDQRPAGGRRLRRPPRRDGVADGRRRHEQRRHPGRARHGAAVGPRGGGP